MATPSSRAGVGHLCARIVVLAALATAFSASAARTQEGSRGFVVETDPTADFPWTPGQMRSFLPERGRFTFPAPYGTEGIRITNASDCGGSDCVEPVGGAAWRNIDAHIGRDSMFIFLGLREVGPTLFRYDKRTGRTENFGPVFEAGSPFATRSGEGWYFSARRPATLYLTSGAQLLRYDVLAKTFETVLDATTEFGEDREIGPAYSSDDDNVHSATLRDSTSGALLGCLAYREDLRRFSYHPASGALAGCEVDTSGRWLVIKENADGVAGVDNRIVDLETGAETLLPGQDGAGGHSANGSGYIIVADNGKGRPGGVRVWHFDQNPPQGELVYSSGSADGAAVGAIAHSNSGPGVPLSQQYACAPVMTARAPAPASEIVCFHLDASGEVRALAQSMAQRDTPRGESAPEELPKGNLDVTGRYFIWVSRTGDRSDAFMVKVPEQVPAAGQRGIAPDVGLTCPTSPVPPGATFTTTVSAGSSAGDRVASYRPGAPSWWRRSYTYVPLPRPATVTLTAPGRVGNYELRLLASNTYTVIGSCLYQVVSAPDTAPPLISGVAASVAQTSATITWTTDEPADTQIDYGTTTAYGSSTTLNPNLVVSHSQAVNGLTAGTLYHYRVKSRDAVGNLATSADFTFTTLATPDTTPPSVSITAPAAGATVSGTVTVAANASDNVGVAGVQFKLDGANLGAEDTTSPYSVSWNTTTAADGNHTLTATARDGAGNATTSAGVNVTVANGGIVTLSPQDTFIKLDATNQSTNPQLLTYTWPDNKVANAILMKFDFSAIPPAATVTDATLHLALVDSDAAPEITYTVTAHKMVGRNPLITAATGYTADSVTAWTPNTCCFNNVPLAQADISAPYDTRAIDKTLGDKSWSITAMAQEWVANPTTNFGLLLNSDTSRLADRYRTFASMEHATASLRPYLRVTYSLVPDVTPPLISAVLASAITSSGATLTWTTNEPSDSQVEYGTTTGYGSLSALNGSLVIAHVATLGGLTPNTLYHYRVRSRDFAGNLAVSGDSTFTTLVLDSTPPTVSITAPAAGATVVATVLVTANATDNVGVVGVQFKLDGANLGAEDTAPPYSYSWNTTTAPNGGHTLTAVARDAAGNTATAPGIAVTVNNPVGPAWPNEPSGFTPTEETGWESGTLGNWYRIFQSADKPITVQNIADSVIAETKALDIGYNAGHVGGGGTELRYDIPAALRRNEIFVGYYVQVNPQWQGHASAINKMIYLHDNDTGGFAAMWYEMFGSGSNPLGLYVVNQSGGSPPGMHENVTAVTFTRGMWHKVEIYQKQGAANNGIVRVWVNGLLAIDRSDVNTLSSPINNVTISGIWGGVGDSKNQADYMRFDRIRISRPGP